MNDKIFQLNALRIIFLCIQFLAEFRLNISNESKNLLVFRKMGVNESIEMIRKNRLRTL